MLDRILQGKTVGSVLDGIIPGGGTRACLSPHAQVPFFVRADVMDDRDGDTQVGYVCGGGGGRRAVPMKGVDTLGGATTQRWYEATLGGVASPPRRFTAPLQCAPPPRPTRSQRDADAVGQKQIGVPLPLGELQKVPAEIEANEKVLG